MQTYFFEHVYEWTQVRATKPPFPLLPEGFMLKTNKGTYLIGSGFDSADELQEAINAHIAKPDAEPAKDLGKKQG